MKIDEPSQKEKYQPYAKLMFSTLSNDDALRIFELAAEGIDANKRVLEEQHFSKKRYYVRLRKLVEMGLIAKDNGIYVHTPLGAIIYENQVASLKRILDRKGSLDVLRDLQQRNKSEALQSAVSDLSLRVLKDVETTISLSNLHPIKLMKTWDEFASQVSDSIRAASSEVTMAVRSLDSKIANAALKAAESGCIVDIIHSEIREFTSPSNFDGKSREDVLKAINALRTNPNVSIRRSGMLYSFFVIDKANVAIEIPHPGKINSFFLGVSFHNPNIATKLDACYREIVKGVKIDSVVPMIDSDKLSQIK